MKAFHCLYQACWESSKKRIKQKRSLRALFSFYRIKEEEALFDRDAFLHRNGSTLGLLVYSSSSLKVIRIDGPTKEETKRLYVQLQLLYGSPPWEVF